MCVCTAIHVYTHTLLVLTTHTYSCTCTNLLYTDRSHAWRTNTDGREMAANERPHSVTLQQSAHSAVTANPGQGDKYSNLSNIPVLYRFLPTEITGSQPSPRSSGVDHTAAAALIARGDNNISKWRQNLFEQQQQQPVCLKSLFVRSSPSSTPTGSSLPSLSLPTTAMATTPIVWRAMPAAAVTTTQSLPPSLFISSPDLQNQGELT